MAFGVDVGVGTDVGVSRSGILALPRSVPVLVDSLMIFYLSIKLVEIY